MASSRGSTPFGVTIPQGMKTEPLPLKRIRLFTTAEIRQAWASSFKNEEIGKRLSVRQLPICCLRRQVNVRKCKSAEPYYWLSEEDKRKIVERKKCFARQWSAEVSKRTVAPRPSYSFNCRASTPPKRNTITEPIVHTESFFQKASPHRSKTHEEKTKTSRHFVSPEWNSENVSWKRFNKTSLEIHRYSLF